ncbi:MAG: response regulator [Chloroflexi bacterium]|nr:response regulator [Chloroflexota bacterium]
MVEREETILQVDDEESILSSLQRLFRTDDYHTFTAVSAEEGLGILDQSHVWLVITDNIMPGMSGVQFLKEVRDRWPDVVRIMLTGCADLNSAMEAINRGDVYRFVTKPWDPDELRMLVHQGLEQHRLIQENRRMRALIEERNATLKSWAAGLQQTVEERTAELAGKNDELAELSKLAITCRHRRRGGRRALRCSKWGRSTLFRRRRAGGRYQYAEDRCDSE